MTDSQPITAIDGNPPTDPPAFPNAVNHVAHLVTQAEAPSDSAVLSVIAQLGITVSTVQIDRDIAVASSQTGAARV